MVGWIWPSITMASWWLVRPMRWSVRRFCGEVVGADLLAAVAASYLLLALFGLDLVDALGFDLIQTAAEDAHGLLAVFDL